MNTKKDYRDELYGVYASGHTSHLYREETAETIGSEQPAWAAYFGGVLPRDKRARILDIGCGTGSFVYWLQGLGYANATGIDVSKEQVAIAEKLGITNIREGDLREALKAAASGYDAIVARDVLEHFKKEEVLEILKLVFLALAPGGVFIAQTLNGESPFVGRLRYGDFTHETCFTKSSMEQILSWAGFSRVSIRPQDPVVHGFVSFVRSALFVFAKYCLRGYLLLETGSSGGILTQNLIAAAWKENQR
ncbi:MAG: class I SAM-dependent methyltransferase [Patescibacteria group bacterium]